MILRIRSPIARRLVMPAAAVVALDMVLNAGLGRWALVSAAGVGIAVAIGLYRSLPPAIALPSAARTALALSLLAFALRAAFGLQELAQTGPGLAFALASDDGDSYYHLASALAHDGNKLADVLGALAYPPGYSMFLATIFAATNESMAVVVVTQALFAAMTVYLVFRVASDLWDPAAGVVAAFLFAVDKNLIQDQSTLTAEALAIPLAISSLYAYGRYRRNGSLGWLLTGALSLGACFLTRNVIGLALAPVVLVWLAAWRGRDAPALLRDAVVTIAAMILIGSPVAAVSSAREGSPRFTTQLAALSWAWDGHGITIGNTFLVERGIDPIVDPWGSVGRVIADPMPVIAFEVLAVPQRISTLLFSYTPGAADPLLVVNPLIYDNPLGDTVDIARLIASSAALVAVVRARWWRARPELGLIGGYFVVYVAIFALLVPPFHPFRYRIPIEPIRFIAEGAGLILLARAGAASVLGSGTVGARVPAA